jgi:hypothetical protein
MKFILRLLLVAFTLGSVEMAVAQDDAFRKERKRTWRKWRSKRQSYNPYLDKKARNKPSAKLARQNKRDLKKKDKAIKRLRKRRKH